MRYIWLLSISLILAGCAGDLNSASPGFDGTGTAFNEKQSYTGARNNQGYAYTVAGDTRVSLAKKDFEPQDPDHITPQEEKRLAFLKHLMAFRIFRYDKDSNKPARLGTDHWQFYVWQNQNGKAVRFDFEGKFSAQGDLLNILPTKAKQDSHYTVEGYLENPKSNSKDDLVTGKLIFKYTAADTVQQAPIFYRAFIGDLTVRANRSQDLTKTPKLLAEVKAFQSVKHAWVNNYTVPLGVSRYHIDILEDLSDNTINPAAPIPTQTTLLTYDGDSLQTGDLVDHPSRILQQGDKNSGVSSVTLEGDGGDNDSRMFGVTLKDDQGNQTQLMVDINHDTATEAAVPPPPPALEDRAVAPAPAVPPADTDTSTQPATKANLLPEESQPKLTTEDNSPQVDLPDNNDDIPVPSVRPKQQTTTVSDAGPDVTGTEKNIFYTDMGNAKLTMAHRMVKDFDSNWSVPGVQAWIKKLTGSKSSRRKTTTYLNSFSPFTPLVRMIAEGYDIATGFIANTMRESRYFYGGQYQIEVAPNSTAFGPLQILRGTAQTMGLTTRAQSSGHFPGTGDERYYFVPSACGSAKYFASNAKRFKSDTTLAFLAYYMGPGNKKGTNGAAGLINTYISKSNDYGYTYAAMAKSKYINKDRRDYVEESLATYFIGKNPSYFGFSMAGAKTQLPTNNTVMPPSNRVANSTCQQIYENYQASSQAIY